MAEFARKKAVAREHIVLLSPSVRMVAADSVAGCSVITPTIGVSSPPVIDPKTETLYAVDKIQALSGSTITYHNRLHAIDLRTGYDRFAPAEIGGMVTLQDGSQLAFYPQRQQNRPGLVLANGAVYVAFGSSCDAVPGSVHGWLFAYDAQSLQPRAIVDTTASSSNAFLGSIWQSTFAPTVDAGGNLYLATGNGTFDANVGRASYAESILRLSPSLTTHQSLTTNDQDVGSAGVMLIPDGATPGLKLAVGGEKDGRIYPLDRTRRYRSTSRRTPCMAGRHTTTATSIGAAPINP